MPDAKFRKTFDDAGDFAACNAAERWCAARGISVGSAQGTDPRGLLLGDYSIQKWRNLNARERCELDGTMTGDMRYGPATITLSGTEADYPLLVSECAT